MQDTITLRLSGQVHLKDYVAAMSKLGSLVDALSKEVAAGAKIDWSVEALEAGSASTTFKGLAEEEAQQAEVEKIVRAYEQVGSSIESGLDIPYSREVSDAALGIASVLNGHIKEIFFETDEMEAVITDAVKQPNKRSGTGFYSFGAIEGRVQTLSSRQSLTFTLYDVFGRGIPCHLRTGDEDMMRNAWEKWVVVEGRIRRDAAGKPLSIRKVTDVVVKEAGEPQDYRKARGVLRAGANAVSAEEAIRRLRDA